MQPQELREKSKEELEKLLMDSREKLRQLRFDLSSGKVKNVREIREIKKDIARILTLEADFTLISTLNDAEKSASNQRSNQR